MSLPVSVGNGIELSDMKAYLEKNFYRPRPTCITQHCAGTEATLLRRGV
jgi:hypothetical protein